MLSFYQIKINPLPVVTGYLPKVMGDQPHKVINRGSGKYFDVYVN